MAHQMGLEAECRLRGISYEVIAENTYAGILAEIQDPAVNMELVKLEKAPALRCTPRLPNSLGMMP